MLELIADKEGISSASRSTMGSGTKWVVSRSMTGCCGKWALELRADECGPTVFRGIFLSCSNRAIELLYSSNWPLELKEGECSSSVFRSIFLSSSNRAIELLIVDENRSSVFRRIGSVECWG